MAISSHPVFSGDDTKMAYASARRDSSGELVYEIYVMKRSRTTRADRSLVMAECGWEEAEATQPGEGGANYGRWPYPVAPRGGARHPPHLLRSSLAPPGGPANSGRRPPSDSYSVGFASDIAGVPRTQPSTPF
jgi:hypothetical protein